MLALLQFIQFTKLVVFRFCQLLNQENGKTPKKSFFPMASTYLNQLIRF